MEYQILLYWCSSFFAVGYVLELFLLRKKLELKLKFCWYNKFLFKIIFMIICLIYSVYFIICEWELLSYYYLLGGLVASIVQTYLKQTQKEDCFAINNCQKDTESIGAFWAHQAYDAYYKIILENIKKRMTMFEQEKDINFLIKKLIIVIPLSCEVNEVLTDKDKSIKEIDFLPIIECDQGANINRNFKNPVYGIETLLKTIYIAAEYSSPLNTLWEAKDDLRESTFKYHRDCFIKTLKFLVRNDPCIVVEYNDTDDSSESLSTLLLSTLRKENTIILPF